jgi:hypothetical protein
VKNLIPVFLLGGEWFWTKSPLIPFRVNPLKGGELIYFLVVLRWANRGLGVSPPYMATNMSF